VYHRTCKHVTCGQPLCMLSKSADDVGPTVIPSHELMQHLQSECHAMHTHRGHVSLWVVWEQTSIALGVTMT